MSVIEQLLTVRVSDDHNRWDPADVRKLLFELYHHEYEDGLRTLTNAFRKWVINNTDEAADNLFDCIYAGHLGLEADNPYFLYEECHSIGGGMTYEGCVMLTRVCDQLPLYAKCKVTVTPNMMMKIEKYNSNFLFRKQLSM